MKSLLWCASYFIYTSHKNLREFERITRCFQDWLKVSQNWCSNTGLGHYPIQLKSQILCTFVQEKLWSWKKRQLMPGDVCANPYRQLVPLRSIRAPWLCVRTTHVCPKTKHSSTRTLQSTDNSQYRLGWLPPGLANIDSADKRTFGQAHMTNTCKQCRQI